MSIFSLVKGEKEHEVFEMRMEGGPWIVTEHLITKRDWKISSAFFHFILDKSTKKRYDKQVGAITETISYRGIVHR